MAFDAKPSTWLGAGYSLASHVAGFQTNDASSNKTLPQLTDAQANATTGDIRNVSFALVEALYQAWIAQGSTGQPTKMTIGRSTQGTAAGTLLYSYSFQFQLSPPAGAYSIASE